MTTAIKINSKKVATEVIDKVLTINGITGVYAVDIDLKNPKQKVLEQKEITKAINFLEISENELALKLNLQVNSKANLRIIYNLLFKDLKEYTKVKFEKTLSELVLNIIGFKK